MLRPLPLFATAALLLGGPVLAAPAPVPKITPVAVSQATLETMVRTLSSNEYEGRAPSTYHQPSDEYDGNWDWAGPLQTGELYYRLGRSLAMTTDLPNWHATDEFRAIRDRSRAGK